VNATNKYTDAVAFSGADVQPALPKPSDRNLFTYLGGSATVNPALGGSKRAPNNVLQTGWTPVDIDAPSVEPGTTACVDNFRIGEINSTTEGQWASGKPNYTGTPYAGMLPAADGVCDLQEALQLTKVNLGTDNGQTDGVKGGAIPTAFLADKNVARNFVQVIRGYCYAIDPTKAPAATTDCVADALNINVSNPEVGGFVHSQPAVVPASAFITDAPAGTHRPSVLYIGGLDGQLHAFYVPSDGKDNGYTGPANAVGSYNTAATSVFKKPVSGAFDSSTKPLQELWSFIPPGQLPLLQINNAMVDSSPVAIDVFGDFDGTGTRTWHTVVVASAGGSNRELFALDVTNPLKPILLWDLQANFEDQSPFNVEFAPIPLTDDDTGYNPSTQAQAFAWQNGCHAGAANCAVTDFQLPPAGNPPTTGPYNYVNLGASQSISVAQLRRNNAPLFAAFVATNEPQNKTDSGSGIYVFAVDVVTGQKIWEFNNPYNLSDDPQTQINGIGNTPPAGVTLFSKAGNSLIDTAYVGDDEGSLWELDAADGLNVNSYAALLGTSSCLTGFRCNFALSQAYGNGANGPQPISSLSTIFILPPTYPATGPLAAYRGQALLAYGTAGTDTVSGLEPAPDATGAPCPTPCINGAVHLIPLAPPARYSVSDLLADSSKMALVQQGGVVKADVTSYPMWLTNGERVYGSIVVAGDQLFFNTTQGSVSQLDQRGNLSGAAYRMNLSATSNPLWNYVTGNGLTKVGGAGGTPLVDSKTGAIVVVTDKFILRFDPPPGAAAVPPSGPSVNGRGATPTGFLSWFFRRRGLEY
jgi:type IV pilus assembly protein PilY1